MPPQRLFFQPDGRVQLLHDDDAFDFLERADIGVPTIRRASNVEPTERCGWQFDLSPLGLPIKGMTAFSRSQALAEERERVEWLLEDNKIK